MDYEWWMILPIDDFGSLGCFHFPIALFATGYLFDLLGYF